MLEVGFGRGAFLAYARQQRWQSQGIEAHPDLVATARHAGLDVLAAQDVASFFRIGKHDCSLEKASEQRTRLTLTGSRMKARPIIVTLTSIPPRFGTLGHKLASLERQTVRPDGIELYIARSYRRFPGPRPNLPTLPASVRVIEVDEDLGPATKVLPAAARWRGENVDLLLCDDDRPEEKDWLERFARARHERPSDIIAEAGWCVDDVVGGPRLSMDSPRVQSSRRLGKNFAYHLKRLLSLRLHNPKIHIYSQSGYADVFLGVYGAMMSPSVFHPDAWKIPDVIWTVDDVWLSGMARVQGVKVWVNAVNRVMQRDGPVDRTSALKHHVEQGFGRDDANRLCIQYMREHYGIWR